MTVRVNEGDGQLTEYFTPAMKTAIFETMQAEVEFGLGRYEQAVALSEQVIDRLEVEPYEMNLIFDTGLIAYEATKVLLRAQAASSVSLYR